MSKIAIFVEGQTEQIFVEKLIEEIAGKNKLSSTCFKFTGPASSRIRQVVSSNLKTGSSHEAFIFDSSGDTRVASDIFDNYSTLIAAGYDAIIGIRDLYPEFILTDMPNLRRYFGQGSYITGMSPIFTFAAMECEAWFIAEHNHFSKINRGLTVAKILRDFGIDVSVDDIQLVPNPADFLNRIYASVGYSYSKKMARIYRTVNSLDFAEIFLNHPNRFPDLRPLIQELDRLLV